MALSWKVQTGDIFFSTNWAHRILFWALPFLHPLQLPKEKGAPFPIASAVRCQYPQTAPCGLRGCKNRPAPFPDVVKGD